MRPDGLAKANGRARYTADALPRPHLVAAPLVTTYPHARVRVDTDALLSLPGVVAALGPQHDPGWLYSTNPHGGADDTRAFPEVGCFPGDIVGAVAATDRLALDAALAFGAVEEQPLDAVTSVAASRERSAIANPDYPDNLIAELWAGTPREEVLAALSDAPRRHRSEVRIGPAPHGFMERVAAAGQWEDGRLRLWSPTQCPRHVQENLSHLLGTEVRMEPVFIGGGFGGKEEMALEPIVALLAQHCGGRPVLIELSRAQCTAAYRSRHGGQATVESGFDEDGRFLARLMSFEYMAGPYDGHSANVLANSMGVSLRLYPYGAVAAAGRAWATNTTLGAAYRGYGAPQAIFAVETHVNQVGQLLEIDPIELRRRNIARAGARDPASGAAMDGVRGTDCLDALAWELETRSAIAPAPARSEQTATRVATGTGFGVLVCTSAAAAPGAADSAEAAVRFEPDQQRIVVETAVAEAGQGIQPAIVETVSRLLDAPPGLISIEQVSELADGGMFGSRGAHVTCSAVAIAARELNEALCAEATQLLGTPATVIYGAGIARAISGAAVLALEQLPPLRQRATYTTEHVGLAFGVQAAEVEVDRLTGQVRVRRVISIHDAGVLVSPATATAQVEGGVLQGIGMALHETLTHRADGTAVEQGLFGHLMPTMAELPEVHTVFIQDADWSGPGTGAKGIGEATVMAMPAAIANAIADATGLQPDRFPMTAESLVRRYV